MNSYGIFASLYDELTENVEYEKRANYILAFFSRHGIKKGTIVDLACGTGSITKEFINKGFNVVGVDLSTDMLSIAQNKLSVSNGSFSLINADISTYNATEAVDGVICCLDSINHLNDQNEVQSTFNNVYNYLKDEGIFVFDVNTVYKHSTVLANNTFVFDNDDYYLVWDNELLNERTVRILLDIFIYNGNSYDRYSEEFEEIAYTIEEMKKMLLVAGFKNVECYDELTEINATEESERIYFVCEK